MKRKVRLVRVKGTTSIHIDAEITDKGALLLSGQDVGQAPHGFWGDSDYAYWLRITAANKDKVLLALIQKLYSGNTSAIDDLKDYLESKRIPCEFSSYA